MVKQHQLTTHSAGSKNRATTSRPESPSEIDIETASKDSANQTLGAQFHSAKKPAQPKPLETLFAEISLSPFLEKLGAEIETPHYRDAKAIPDAFSSNGLAFRNQNHSPSFIDFSSTKYVTPFFSRLITQSSLSRNLKLRLPLRYCWPNSQRKVHMLARQDSTSFHAQRNRRLEFLNTLSVCCLSPSSLPTWTVG